MRSKVVVGAITLSFVGFATAETLIWTGNAGVQPDGSYLYDDAANWSPNQVPGVWDSVVFDKGEDVALSSTSEMKFLNLKVASGNVYMTSAKSVSYGRSAACTSTVEVATGCAFVASNNWECASSVVVFDKRGGGLFHHLGEFGRYWKPEAGVVSEGEFRIEKSAGYYTHHTYVRTGAIFRADTANAFWQKDDGYFPFVDLEQGAFLKLKGSWGGFNLSGISGAGTVSESTPSGLSGKTLLTLTPQSRFGDVLFDGAYDDARVYVTIDAAATARYVVSNPNAFANVGSLTGTKNLAFAAGATNPFLFYIWYPDADNPVNLETVDGEPVTVIGYLPANFEAEGCGNLYSRGDLTLTGSKIHNTGALGVVSGKTLTLGDGVADFDLSNASALDSSNGTITVNNSAKLQYGGRIAGTGTFNFMGEAVLADVRGSKVSATDSDGLVLNVGSALTLAGGDSQLEKNGLGVLSAGASLEVSDGRFYSAPTADASLSFAATPVPGPVSFAGIAANRLSASFLLSGGEFWFSGAEEANGGSGSVGTFGQNGGTLHLVGWYYPPSVATSENPAKLVFDGGTTFFSFKFPYQGGEVGVPASDALSVGIGVGGATFRTEGQYANYYGPSVGIKVPIRGETTGSAIDGGLSLYGYPVYRFASPLGIAGRFKGVGGIAEMTATGLTGTVRPFGSGDIELENERLVVCDQATSAELEFAVGKMLSYSGDSTIKIRKTSGGAVQTVRLGALSRIPGGALFLYDGGKALGGAGASSVRLQAVPATNAFGMVAQPVLVAQNGYMLDFAAVDANGQISSFSDYVSTAAEKCLTEKTDGKVAFLTSSSATGNQYLGTERTPAAIKMDIYMQYTLQKGARIRFASATPFASLLMCGQNKLLCADESCAVDFGESEGVIVLGGLNTTRPDADESVIDVPISGTMGVSVVGFGDDDNGGCRSLKFGRANVYQGDTHIGHALVRASDERCFSTGHVYVSDGERDGGSVFFNAAGGTWANDFTVAGWGTHGYKWGGNFKTGALSFQQSGTVSGDVEVAGRARFASYDGAVGIFSGVISGGAVLLYESAGEIVFAGHNTYTGGTEVADSAVLALKFGDSAGTGKILLNSGVLKFVNDEPIVFTNEVEGVGSVVFAGSAPVTLSSKSFAALPFGTFAKGTTLVLPNLESSVVVPHFAGETDLGGGSFSVAGVSGTGRVSNGRLTVSGAINPGGAGVVGALSFGEGVLVLDGAKYVCDVIGTSADVLSIDGDVSCAALSFEAVRAGKRTAMRQDVFTCSGTVSGKFASEDLPDDTYALGYAEAAVELACHPKGLAITVR